MSPRRTRSSAEFTTLRKSNGSGEEAVSSRASCTRSPIRVRELHELSLHVGHDVDPILLLQHATRGVGCQKFDVGAQAGERRTQLVPRVRDQLGLPFPR